MNDIYLCKVFLGVYNYLTSKVGHHPIELQVIKNGMLRLFSVKKYIKKYIRLIVQKNPKGVDIRLYGSKVASNY